MDLPDGWTCGVTASGASYAEGPCPKCGGASYGPHGLVSAGVEIKEVAVPTDITAETRVRTIYRACHCDHDHGEEGAGSCGRRWTVLCPAGEEDE